VFFSFSVKHHSFENILRYMRLFPRRHVEHLKMGSEWGGKFEEGFQLSMQKIDQMERDRKLEKLLPEASNNTTVF